MLNWTFVKFVTTVSRLSINHGKRRHAKFWFVMWQVLNLGEMWCVITLPQGWSVWMMRKHKSIDGFIKRISIELLSVWFVGCLLSLMTLWKVNRLCGQKWDLSVKIFSDNSLAILGVQLNYMNIFVTRM